MNFYSYSKISCYNTCPLQYNLQYVQKVKLPRVYSYAVMKGNVFHRYAEVFRGNRREAMELAFTAHEDVSQEYIDRLTKEEKQFIVSKLPLYDQLWETKFKDNDVKHEYKLFVSKKYAFTGYIDTLVKSGDLCTILDFKTAKAANTSIYADQIRTYAHFLSLQEGVPISKMDGAVFFPFAEDVKNPTHETLWKPIKITEENVEKTMKKFDETIAKIESGDISKEANINFLCQWCSYAGTEHCPVSIVAGLKKAT